MAVDWTDVENEVIVAAYLDLLDAELRNAPLVKTRVNETVRKEIARSHGSVEFKFRNVSAVLRELSHPWVQGYRPAPNFQSSLRDAVVHQLHGRGELRAVATAELGRPPQTRVDVEWNLTEAPKVEFSPHREFLRKATKVDFVQVDAANRDLGLAGECAVVDLERSRLQRAGASDLARLVVHASVEEGDGLGYDVRSFTPDGREKYIEVKTTRRGAEWPMLVSDSEVRFSQAESERFHLYRVYDFDASRRGLFELRGDITESCILRPATYQALPA